MTTHDILYVTQNGLVGPRPILDLPGLRVWLATPKSALTGMAFDVIVFDEPLEASEHNRRWIETVLAARLKPGARVILAGQ